MEPDQAVERTVKLRWGCKLWVILLLVILILLLLAIVTLEVVFAFADFGEPEAVSNSTSSDDVITLSPGAPSGVTNTTLITEEEEFSIRSVTMWMVVALFVDGVILVIWTVCLARGACQGNQYECCEKYCWAQGERTWVNRSLSFAEHEPEQIITRDPNYSNGYVNQIEPEVPVETHRPIRRSVSEDPNRNRNRQNGTVSTTDGPMRHSDPRGLRRTPLELVPPPVSSRPSSGTYSRSISEVMGASHRTENVSREEVDTVPEQEEEESEIGGESRDSRTPSLSSSNFPPPYVVAIHLPTPGTSSGDEGVVVIDNPAASKPVSPEFSVSEAALLARPSKSSLPTYDDFLAAQGNDIESTRL